MKGQSGSRNRTSAVLWLGLAVLAVASVLILNGRPLFYFDTVGYVDQGKVALQQLGLTAAPPVEPSGGTVAASALRTVDGSRSPFYSLLAGIFDALHAVDLLLLFNALVLALAVDALGADRVRTVMMPSPYTADISWIDARDMAGRVGVRYDELAIAPMFDAFRETLAPQFAGLADDATEENLQARIRGTLLMALSNKSGWIVLTTGNKSEMATGYCTLYGDMAGGFAVIKDVAKTLVYRLAEWRNQQPTLRADGTVRAVIPERIITRAPSAELRPDQTDQDSLPPYEVLDGILARYMEEDQGIEDIVAAGYARADVERVTRLIKLNEYKRRQAPVGIRITHRAFGRDWRYPITSKFRA